MKRYLTSLILCSRPITFQSRIQLFPVMDSWNPTYNSLPNDQILDLTKLKAFADDKINVAQMMISVFDWIENIVEKGENAGYQHFLLFPQCLQKASFLGR